MSSIEQLSLFEFSERRVPCSIGAATVTTTESTHLLTVAKGRIGAYDYTLNPYRGCSFGCSYCYAPFFEPDEKKREDWGLWVEVKHRAVQSLSKVKLSGKTIFMSSVTDPYQPVEAKTGLTRSVVEELLKQQARLVVQTRSPISERDIDLFQQFDAVRINVSIPTDSDAVRRRFEPNCASVERRLETVARLKAAGLRVSVCVCPMLPMEDPEGFGRKLVALKVDRYAASWFHESDKLFASNTRPGALALAREYQWTKKRFEECKARLDRVCEPIQSGYQAFAPV